MRPVINHLIQLQEMNLIRDEQKLHGNTGHLEQLDTAIKQMTGKLPKDVHSLYLRLHKKDHVVIAPVDAEACAACRMQLPISQLQAIRMAKEIRQCPNCARMLYFPQVHVRRTSKTPRRTAPRKVGISRFSSPSLMVPALQSGDKESIITELATLLEERGFVDNAEELVNRSLDREAIVGTALEHGLAFPHARGVEGGGLALAMGICRKGVKWDGPGKGLTKIVFFVSIPTAASAFYLKLVAGLAETFAKADPRKALMAEKDPEKLWKTLCKLTRTHVK